MSTQAAAPPALEHDRKTALVTRDQLRLIPRRAGPPPGPLKPGYWVGCNGSGTDNVRDVIWVVAEFDPPRKDSVDFFSLEILVVD